MKNLYQVIIDQDTSILTVIKDSASYIFSELGEGVHELEIFKRTEAACGTGTFYGLELAEGGRLLKPRPLPERKLLFIGNSITCGYGNEGANQNCQFSPETENAWLSYASIASRSLDAQFHLISFSGKGVLQNYDTLDPQTMPVLFEKIHPFEELTWNHSDYVPNVVIVNLGTNDFAHENPDSTAFIEAYTGLLKKLRRYYPEAKILLLSGPMMSDQWPPGKNALSTLKQYLKHIQRNLDDDNIFLYHLSGQGANGYGCNWHPSVLQHRINASELEVMLRKILKWN